MFEKVNVRFSERSTELKDELLSLVMDDPVFSAFVEETGGLYQALDQLKAYAEGDSVFKQRIGDMSSAVYLMQEADMIGFPGLQMHNIIMRINKANGYEYTQNDVYSMYVNPDRWPEEKNGPAEGRSFSECCYSFLDGKGYHEIQTDKRAAVLIQLAHISEKLMDKLNEIEQHAVIETYEDKFTEPLKADAQKGFFERLTADELECMVDEKKMAARQDELSAEIKKREAALKVCEGHGAESARLIDSLLKNDPKTQKELERIKAENTAAAEKQLEKELAEFREKLIRRNEGNKELNEDILRDNAESQKINEELDAKIEEIRKRQQEQLKVFDDAEKRAEELRSSRRAQLDAEMGSWAEKERRLPEMIEAAEDDIKELTDFVRVSQFMSDAATTPPDSHFDALKALEDKNNAVDEVRDLMFRRSGKERGALSAVAMLEPDQVKAVAKVKKKLTEATNELNKAMSALEAGREKGLAEAKLKDLNTKAELAAQKFQEQSRQMAPYRDAASVQEAFDRLMENREIRREYQELKAKHPDRNVYECLSMMQDGYAGKTAEEKKKYGSYYTNLAQYETAKRHIAEGKLVVSDSMEQIYDILSKRYSELEAARKELKELKKPDVKAFNEETERQCKAIYDKDAATASKAQINRDADKSVALLNEQREELTELEEILDEKGIEDAVGKEKEKLSTLIDLQFKARSGVAQNQYIENRSKELAEAHARRLHEEKTGLAYRKEQLTLNKERLDNYYKEQKNAYDAQQSLKNDWETACGKGYGLDKTLEKNLKSIISGIEKGRVADHNDTTEYKDMKKALVAVSDFVSANKSGISSVNPETMAELKKKLDTMKQTADFYYQKKQGGIHWRSSDMRFVRLDSAKRISKLADDTKYTIHSVEKLQFRKEVLNSKAKNWAVEDPGANAKEYALKSVPRETSDRLRVKLEHEQQAQKQLNNARDVEKKPVKAK